jgi:hypothetical protein
MERRLGEAPLAPPEVPLARDEALSEVLFEALVKRALMIVAGVVDENVLDIAGPGE